MGYSHLLEKSQEIRFDLGLDEYKDVIPTIGARGTSEILRGWLVQGFVLLAWRRVS